MQLSRFRGCDHLTGFGLNDWIYIQLVTAGNTALWLIYTFYSSPLHYTYTSVLNLHWSYPGNGFQHLNYASLAVTQTHMKSSPHRLTFKSRLNSLSSLPNHLRLSSQETPSILYQLALDPTENNRLHRYSSTTPRLLILIC
jgi:hypothetical protein